MGPSARPVELEGGIIPLASNAEAQDLVLKLQRAPRRIRKRSAEQLVDLSLIHHFHAAQNLPAQRATEFGLATVLFRSVARPGILRTVSKRAGALGASAAKASTREQIEALNSARARPSSFSKAIGWEGFTSFRHKIVRQLGPGFCCDLFVGVGQLTDDMSGRTRK